MSLSRDRDRERQSWPQRLHGPIRAAPLLPGTERDTHRIGRFAGEEAEQVSREIVASAWEAGQMIDMSRREDAMNYVQALYHKSSSFLTLIADAFEMQHDDIQQLRDLVSRNAGELSAIEKRAEELSRDNRELGLKFERLSIDFHEMQKENEERKATNQKLEGRLNDVIDENKRLSDANERLTTTNSVLTEQVSSLQRHVGALGQEVADYKSLSYNLSQDNVAIKADNAVIKAENAALKADVSSLRDQFNQLRALVLRNAD